MYFVKYIFKYNFKTGCIISVWYIPVFITSKKWHEHFTV